MRCHSSIAAVLGRTVASMFGFLLGSLLTARVLGQSLSEESVVMHGVDTSTTKLIMQDLSQVGNMKGINDNPVCRGPT